MCPVCRFANGWWIETSHSRVCRRADVGAERDASRFKFVGQRHVVTKEAVSGGVKEEWTNIINSSLGCKYYLGIFRPTTPAKTVPVCSPMRIFKKEANEKTDVLLKQLEIRKRWPGAVLLSASLILKLKMKYVYVQQKQKIATSMSGPDVLENALVQLVVALPYLNGQK